MRGTLVLCLLACSFLCFSQDPYLFIGTYTSGKSKGIYVYRFNTATAASKEVSTLMAANPSYLCLSGNGKHLYATSEDGKGGSVSAFAFEPSTGQLALLNTQSAGGTCTCYVSEDKAGKWIFAANYCSGTLAALPVNSDGSLAPASQVIQQTGKGADTSRQESPHVHSTIFSPDEKYLLAADLGTDMEHVYAFNPSQTIPLTGASDSVISVTAGTGPRHIVFSPNGKNLYILGELSGTVDAYSYDSSNGKTEHLQRIRSTQDSFRGDPGSADIHMRSDGKYLYATNRGSSNTIAVFAVGKDGKLEIKQVLDVGGKHPRNFVIDPTDHFLLIANRDTDNVVIFSIDARSGLLRNTGKQISIPAPVCLKFLVP